MSWLKSRLALSVAAVAVACGLAYAAENINPTGRPAGTHKGAVERYSLWHDGEGWHLRTMTAEHEHHFRGHIDAHKGIIVHEHGKNLEGHGAQADHWVLGPEKHRLTFDFSTKGGEDGIDWRVEGEDPELEFNLEIGEKDPKFIPDRIFIGKEGAHPSSGPFSLPAHPGEHHKK
jgi:hypothetical protein